MSRRQKNLSLSMQFALIMLCFVVVVACVSSMGIFGTRTLSKAQNDVRDLTSALTSIEAVERSMLARQLALADTLVQGTPESRRAFEKANNDTNANIETLLRLQVLDQQALSDAVAIQVASTQWLNLKALPLLMRFDRMTQRTDRTRVLAEYLAANASRMSQTTELVPTAIFDRLSDLVQHRLTEARELRDLAIDGLRNATFLAAALVALTALGAFALLHYRFSRPIGRFATTMGRLAGNDRSVLIPFQDRRDEIGAMSRSLLVFRNIAVSQVEDLEVKRALTRLSDILQAQKTLKDFAQAALDTLCHDLGASVAVFFSHDEAKGRLHLFAAHGYHHPEGAPKSYALGEGLVGQVGADRRMKILSPVPPGYLRVQSGTGAADPQSILLLPVVLHDRLIGVMEFALDEPFDSVQGRIIAEAIDVVGLPLVNLQRALETKDLLQQSLRQTEELQAAETEMMAQQEELRATNAELAFRSTELEQTQEEAFKRAEELERTSQYKSRFLANMSHELRTPLNSMLILAQDLATNSTGNLDADQVEGAQVIHASGVSLLRLINEILDLSKIEAGKIEIQHEPMSTRALIQTLEHAFRPLAQKKGVGFSINGAADLPATILTDPGRMEQIANNLIGNALKFTREGAVNVTLAPGDDGRTLCFVVRDTGIGIPQDKLQTIFLPFEQVDASTQRQFGGTGLGLSISHQLATLLGGTLEVESVVDQGSVFRLTLPLIASDGAAPAPAPPAPLSDTAEPPRPAPPPPRPAIPVRTAGGSVLVIEDDDGTQKAISQLLARARIGVTPALSAEHALDLLKAQDFDCAIVDLGLPGISGIELLDQLEKLGKTLPIVVYSARDLLPDELLRLRGHTESIVLKGEYSDKRLLEEVRAILNIADSAAPAPPPAPADPAPAAPAAPPLDDGTPIACKLLLVDDDMRNIYALAKVLRARGCDVVLAQDGLKALAELEAHPDTQLVLMDMMMPNMDGYEAMTEIRKRGGDWADLPIIALTAKAMKQDRERCIAAGASDYMSKPIDVPVLLGKIREQLQHAA
ncbi:response regulator [Paracoccus shanxieyensis]|uniref:histidine kinase n=1 Tax=Paracoccus shanxieyensis TaxID=2675752 RepID=A0A6L6IWN8_9RHOB|nr:response regulator [Paracoccus shanxieyensis]MTH64028.1 response regulator [Paracoccus shanxieyensis]MTH86931.1 response regulator [Paracoccus shanxieyensis]